MQEAPTLTQPAAAATVITRVPYTLFRSLAHNIRPHTTAVICTTPLYVVEVAMIYVECQCALGRKDGHEDNGENML